MKNIFLILLLAVGLMSFTSSKEINNDLIPNDYIIQMESLDGEMDGRCKWRFCHYRNGIKYCTEWTYGECLDAVEIQ